MVQNDSLDVARKEMLALLRAGRRSAEWSRERPVDWNPGSVVNPRSGMPFTHQTCWHFIEDLLDEGHEIELVILDKPPGKKGYVVLFATEPAVSDIYIKLQIGSGCLLGRSFHYSYVVN